MAIFRWIATDGRFDIASSWANTTLRINPARVPPRLADTVNFFTGGGTISGSGDVSGLNIQGGNDVPWSIAGTLQSGVSFVNGATQIVSGGSWDSGSLSIGLTGGIDVQDGGTLTATDLTIDLSHLSVSANGVAVVGFSAGVAGFLIVDTSLSGTGTITAASGIVDDGTITASGGRLTLSGAVSGSGTLQIGSNSVLSLTGVSTPTISFIGDAGVLEFGRDLTSADPAITEQGVIIGFLPGDTIRYTGPDVVTSVQASVVTPGLTTLTLFSDTVTLGTLSLTGDFSAETFNVGPLDVGGTPITLVPSDLTLCLLNGTRIETSRGKVVVEDLRIGETIVTASGDLRPVKWLGYQRVEQAVSADPSSWPVRVRAGAFADQMPSSDLWLSPEHAVFVDDVLIPIRCLVNGHSIEHVRRENFTYWHVELDEHDVMIAEGMPVETLLCDAFSIFTFDNVADAEMPDGFAAPCAPVMTQGPVVSTVKARLRGRILSAAGQRARDYAI